MINELMFIPPEVLMGEAGICGFWAMVAIAQVFQQNHRMNGWQEPDLKAVLASMLWAVLPDASGGANYVFSREDLEREDVQEIVGSAQPGAVWECAVGELIFYSIR